ncbi:MAG: NfeD family protein [Desulfotomaculum sp.]|nr:NfeD family protein [Desulfotomaculum sp.]
MEDWQMWLIMAVVLFIAEIFTPGFLLACLGVACLMAGLMAYLGLGLEVQIIAFSVSALAVFFGIRPLLKKHSYFSESKLKTNVAALVDKTGIVVEKIDPVQNKGRVVVGGENWKGVSIDGTMLKEGAKVTVVRVEGTKLLVKRLVDLNKT